MHRSRPVRLASTAIALVLAAAAAGCKTTGSSDPTQAYAMASAPRSEADWRRDIDAYGARYRADARDPEAAIRYAHALRHLGQRAQAVAVLEQASMHNPRNTAVLGAYGRALADVGQYGQALEVLNRAHSPDQPDWRILSAQGAVLDQLGRPDEARRYYASALRLAPDEPSVLSNLGLSYALSKDLPQAEQTLRRAVDRPGAHPRARQNLALVVGLQGRFEDAEKIARADLPAEEAAANVAYLRKMLSEQNSWKKLAKPSESKPAAKAAKRSNRPSAQAQTAAEN
jgi:Flp pilus assembly protein TadD